MGHPTSTRDLGAVHLDALTNAPRSPGLTHIPLGLCDVYMGPVSVSAFLPKRIGHQIACVCPLVCSRGVALKLQASGAA